MRPYTPALDLSSTNLDAVDHAFGRERFFGSRQPDTKNYP
jgi:hypothetical protein